MPLRLTVLLFAITFLASAQIQPHFGFSAGVPLTDTLISSQSSSTVSTSSSFSRYNSVTKRLLIGPAFQLDLIRGFGLEFDALWQRVDSDATTQSTQSTSPPYFFYAFQQTTANRWQFPLLVQYAHALPRSKTRLFLEFGPSISYLGGGRTTINQINTNPASPFTSTTTSTSSSYTIPGSTQAGVTAGAGVDVTMFHLHLRPQFRYSHWFTANAASQGGATISVLSGVFNFAPAPALSIGLPFSTQSNEASFLLDVVF